MTYRGNNEFFFLSRGQYNRVTQIILNNTKENTMTDTKHTPTPWRIEDGTTLIWGNCNPDDNTDAGMGYQIAECRITPISSSSWCKAPYSEEGEANAAHIVKCVNMHDELVRQNQIMKEALDVVADHDTGSTAGLAFTAKETLKKAGAL